MSTEQAASCRGVVKIYSIASGEVHALKGVDAVFPGGAVSVVVGPSGSGKSSLLRILAAMDQPSAGSVRIGDSPVEGLSARALRLLRRRRIGYMFQRPSDNLVSYQPVLVQLRHAGRLRGLGRDASDEAARDLLGSLGLSARGDHLPHQLSGGEQQRVALAQAVIGDPVLVVADEPTAELDSAAADLLLDRMHALTDRGVSVVVSTHDPKVVDSADQTLALRHGAVESETTRQGSLAVIDAAGRVQLPPEALTRFPNQRAVLRLEDDGVWITPP